jgi:hypothetical protein
VVAARGLLVAEVAPASGEVTYHPLGAAAAKGDVDAWWREATWVGNGRIAVSGEHFRPSRGRRVPDGPVPFGVRLIDTSDWSITTLDARSSVMHVSGDTVLAYGTRWFEGGRRSESTGLLGEVLELSAEGEAEIYQLDPGRAGRYCSATSELTRRAGLSASRPARSTTRPRA